MRKGTKERRSRDRKSCENRLSDWHETTKERGSLARKKPEPRIKTDISLDRLEPADRYKTKQAQNTVLLRPSAPPRYDFDESFEHLRPIRQVHSIAVDRQLQTSDSLLLQRNRNLEEELARMRQEEKRRWEGLVQILSRAPQMPPAELVLALGQLLPDSQLDRSNDTFQNIEDIIDQQEHSLRRFGIDPLEERIRASRGATPRGSAAFMESLQLPEELRRNLSGRLQGQPASRHSSFSRSSKKNSSLLGGLEGHGLGQTLSEAEVR